MAVGVRYRRECLRPLRDRNDGAWYWLISGSHKPTLSQQADWGDAKYQQDLQQLLVTMLGQSKRLPAAADTLCKH